MKMKRETTRRIFIFTIIGLFLFGMMGGAVAEKGECNFNDECVELYAGFTGDNEIIKCIDTECVTIPIKEDQLKEDGFFQKRWGVWFSWVDVWLRGATLEELQSEKLGISKSILKWGLLALIVILFYAGLSQLSSGSHSGLGNPLVKFIIAIILGFFTTFFITTKELLTAMQGFSAAGIALTVFLPLIALLLFTLVVTSGGNPSGILMQKILWIAYGFFLFIKTGWLLLLQNGWVKDSFFGAKVAQTTIDSAKDLDLFVLWTLFIVSIATIIIMGWGNRHISALILKMKSDADIQSKQSELQRASAHQKLQSEALGK